MVDFEEMICAANLPVLCEIFCIHSEGQSESSVTACIDLFQKYLSTCDFPLAKSDFGAEILTSMLKGNDRFSTTWLEAHNSMILATKNGISSTFSLEFIYLDGWESIVTSDISHGRTLTAVSWKWNTLFLGQVPSHDNFSKKFSNATRLNDKEYKHTSALVSDLLEKLSAAFSLSLPNKQLDGLITIRMPNKQSASWSLVKAVINIMIDQNLPCEMSHSRGDCMFERLEVDFYVWVLENMSVTSPVTAQVIDILMSAHATTSQKSAALAEKNFPMTDVENRLDALREKWERLAIQKTTINSTLLIDDATSWTHPVIVLPPETTQPLHGALNIADVRKNIVLNLGALEPFPAFPSLPGRVLGWINSTTKTAARARTHLQPMIRSVERWFFDGALALEGSSTMGLVCQDTYIQDVESVLKLYRDNSTAFQSVAKKSNLPQAELKSLEVLCVWIAFCMVHAAAVKKYPLLDQYDVALDGADLHHLVLSEKLAVNATLAVVSYLKKFSKSRPVIFSLSSQDGTMHLALNYSRADATMINMHNQEVKDAEKKREANYKIVLEKQVLAETLRRKLATAEEEFASFQKRYFKYENRSGWAAHEDDIGRLTSQLASALKSPPMVYQSLPLNKDKAMTNLFFYCMPKSLRTVATLTITATQMLLPRSPLPSSIEGQKHSIDKH